MKFQIFLFDQKLNPIISINSIKATIEKYYLNVKRKAAVWTLVHLFTQMIQLMLFVVGILFEYYTALSTCQWVPNLELGNHKHKSPQWQHVS